LEKNEDSKDLAFDYATFLANSARGSLQEGVFSASLRLVEALERLSQVLPDQVEADPFLKEIVKFVKEEKTRRFLVSKESYIGFLDELLQRFAKEIKTRNGI
jgi:2-hydroxy-3-keto-5-methylthiopentenyl-1-phosphate phosphatase